MKQPEKKKYTLILPGLYAVTFLFVGYIMYNAPLVTDDYLFLAYRPNSLTQAFQYAAHYGNGRLLGNFSTIVLLNHRLALIFEKAVLSVASVAIAARLAAGKDRFREVIYFLLTAVLVFGVSAPIFAEIFTWTSGFQNYFPPIFAMLVCAAVFQYPAKGTGGRIAETVVLFVFGVSAQLFMELSSLMNVVIAAAVFLFCLLKKRKKLFKGIVWLLSLVLGGGFMAVIPVLFPPVTDSVEKYREIHIHGLGDLIANVSENASVTLLGLLGCQILMVVLCAFALILSKKFSASFRKPFWLAVCRIGLLASTAFSMVYSFLCGKTELSKFFRIYALLGAAAYVVFAVCVAAVLIHLPAGTKKVMAIFSAAAAVIAIAPMMLVQPFGPRCLFLSYCFLIACTLFAAGIILEDISEQAVKKVLWTGLSVFAALTACLSIAFTDLGWMSRQQVAYIESKLAEHPKQIEVIHLTTDYVYTKEIWGFGRIYYNEKQNDIEFVYLDFNEWYANRQAEGWY